MSQETNIKENLNSIQILEGSSFTYDEIGIEKEYLMLKANESNIGIKIMSIFGGFIATLAFLGFLFIAGLYDSEIALLIIGVLLIAGSILLNIKYSKLIIDTLSISAYIIGYCLLLLGIGDLVHDENAISIICLVIAITTMAVTQTYMLSFLSVLIINGCFLFLIANNQHFDLIHFYNAIVVAGITYWFLNEAKLITMNPIVSKLYFPVRIGLIISLMFGLISIGKRGLIDISPEYIWLSSVITIPLTIYVINNILTAIGVENFNTRIAFMVASLLFLIPTALSPAISGALLIILLSFLVNYKTSFAIGVLAFIYFIGQYYYDLNFTLLTKSMVLFFSGLVFLGFFLFTYKKLK